MACGWNLDHNGSAAQPQSTAEQPSLGEEALGGVMFRIQVAGVIEDGFTSAEIYSDDTLVAVVYELTQGWKLDLYQSPRGLDVGEFLKVLQAAQARLLEYVNRRGENPPEGLSAVAFSMWLMEKSDGTALGVKLPQYEE
jgi:hypothetical protein